MFGILMLEETKVLCENNIIVNSSFLVHNKNNKFIITQYDGR